MSKLIKVVAAVTVALVLVPFAGKVIAVLAVTAVVAAVVNG